MKCRHCSFDHSIYAMCAAAKREAEETEQSSSDGDFVASAVIGAVTGSAIVGGLLGGDIIGGVVGDLLEGGGLMD